MIVLGSPFASRVSAFLSYRTIRPSAPRLRSGMARFTEIACCQLFIDHPTVTFIGPSNSPPKSLK
jgi:hypothetical protein